MSEIENQVSQRDKKYWIKPGVEVAHRDYPLRKMIVDDILKKTETVAEDGEEKQKTFTIGVECHWFLKDGSYARGRFLTMELIKFGKKQTRIDPDSFPLQIPSDIPSS